MKSWSCTAHDSLNNRRLLNSFLASRSLKIHLIVLKVAWTIVFAIVISIVKTHFRFQVCFYDYSVHHNLHGHWHANLSMAFFNFFLYLHTWYTGDYSSFSFLLDTLCLLVLIIDNIKWKVKGDYSSWVSNHKLFYHFPLYSNYRNSYFTYVTVTIVQFMQPFPQTVKCRLTRLVHVQRDFFLTLVWCFNETTSREPWRNKVSDWKSFSRDVYLVYGKYSQLSTP